MLIQCRLTYVFTRVCKIYVYASARVCSRNLRNLINFGVDSVVCSLSALLGMFSGALRFNVYCDVFLGNGVSAAARCSCTFPVL